MKTRPQRNKLVNVRLTPTEADQLWARATAAGQSVSEYIRHRLSLDAMTADAVYVAAIRDLRDAVERFNGGLERVLGGLR